MWYVQFSLPGLKTLFLLINWNFQIDDLYLKILNERLNVVVGRQAKRPSQMVNNDKWNFFKGNGLAVGTSEGKGCTALSQRVRGP